MTQERIKITDNKFENNGVVYDCKDAIKKDIELIFDEAKNLTLTLIKFIL